MGCKGPQILTLFQLRGSPSFSFFFSKTLPAVERSKSRAARHPKNDARAEESLAAVEVSGPFAAHETLLPAERVFRGSFLREGLQRKNAGYFAVLRVSQKGLGSTERRHFKNVPKSDKIHTSHSAERTLFHNLTLKNDSVPQREGFSELFQS